MFGLPARRRFYNNSAKKEKWDWHRRFGDILSNQREKIVEELDVQKVLSPLVCKGVFSWEEYQEVVSCEEQAASLLEKLSCKAPGAVGEFCSVLEEVCPHWLVSVLLDAQGGLSQTSLEDTPENPKMRRASGTDNHEAGEISDVEGKSSLEDPLNHPFNRHRAGTTAEKMPEDFKHARSAVLGSLIPKQKLTASPAWQIPLKKK